MTATPFPVTTFPGLRPTRLMLALVAALPALAAAAPSSSSAYRTDAQHTHVEDATSRGINTVNMITCIMSALRPDALVNQPTYRALVDEGKCDGESRASSSNSSGAADGAAPSYSNAIVNSSRTANDTPMRVRAWLEQADEGRASTIFINISASAAPTSANPYGVFRMDFCGKADGTPCMMQGYLEGAADGIRFYEQEGSGGMTETKALRLTSLGADSGSGRLSYVEEGTPVNFSFAYNASLFRRSNGVADQCFSRDASDTEAASSVWRYALYDGTSGDAITRNSGFPIEYEAGGQTWRGYMGYWGLNVQGDAPPLADGDTVQRVQYGDGTSVKTPYTVAKADGRLLKYTRHTRTLTSIDKIRFTTWINDASGFYAGAQPQQQYELYWDDAAGMFKVTGVMACGNNGCTSQSLPVEQPVPVSYFGAIGGVRGWSQALGGELFIAVQGLSGSVQSANVEVVYRTQDLVYPADMPANLYCISNCPTQASLTAYFANGSTQNAPYTAESAFRWSPSTSLTAYSMSGATGLLRDAADQAVTFTDAQAMQSRPQYQGGVRSGRLFTTPATALCDGSTTTYCEYRIEGLNEYYVWETGAHGWNQFAALRDAQGHFVQFDAPLNVSYQVPGGAAYGDYAGKALVLQYGGYGDLWGVPGHCVSRMTNQAISCDAPGSRYVPAFSIPFDETLGRVAAGSTPYLVKWLDREIRFARKPLNVCTDAGLTLPTGLVLPGAEGLADPSDATAAIGIGSKPAITAAPRVIHGEVKY